MALLLAPVGEVVNEFASADELVAEAMAGWRPPPRLSLSEWADEHFRLSAESAAEPGRWRTLPYQREMMDALTDPSVVQVSVMKSARVGWTLMLNAFIGYNLHQTPCPILVVQPTVDDAKGYSKESIAPMLRDCPVLAQIVFDEAEENGPRDSGNTILHKKFPGGVLSLVGANSGTGFRRVSRRVVLFDEVDAYPPSAGSDGDPIKLGMKRSEFYWDRKIAAGSTPLVEGASRIAELFAAGDQRRYFVPCPHCGHMAPLVFREPSKEGDVSGHAMTWPEGEPEKAFFTCEQNGCVIEHQDKRAMVEAGEWRAAREPTPQELREGRHVSFHIWAAYSYSPNAKWGQLAKEFIEAKDKPEQLRTFVNTVLGETWMERGEAPDYVRLYERREHYPIGTVPAEALFLTAGVDVQKDRFVYEVVAWGPGKESWSVEIGVIPGDPSKESDWAGVDDLLGRTYQRVDGGQVSVRRLGVDSGYNTNAVYNWVRQHSLDRVIATKGTAGAKALIGAPVAVDVNVRGKRIARGCKVWPVGVDMAKTELYGWLRLARPEDGDPFPAGYCHFPEYDQEFFKQLTAEQLVPHVDRNGFVTHQWEKIPGRENHWLDTRVIARAAAYTLGLDRMKSKPQDRAPRVPALPAAPLQVTADHPRHESPTPPRAPKPKRQRSGFLRGDRFQIRGKPWLKR